MNRMKFPNRGEEEAYLKGFGDGYNEGLKKAALIIQLLASNSEDFKKGILQNRKDAVLLRKLMTGAGQEDI